MKSGRVRAINKKRYDKMIEWARQADTSTEDFLARLAKVGGVTLNTATQAWREGWPREGMSAMREVITGIDSHAIRAARQLQQDEVHELERAWQDGAANEQLRSRLDALRTRANEATMVQVARNEITELMRMVGRMTEATRPIFEEIQRRIPQEIGRMLEGPITVKRLNGFIGLLERLIRAQAQLAGTAPALVRAERLVAGAPGGEIDDEPEDNAGVSAEDGSSASTNELLAKVQYEFEMYRRAKEKAN